jgi:hypothetical protein
MERLMPQCPDCQAPCVVNYDPDPDFGGYEINPTCNCDIDDDVYIKQAEEEYNDWLQDKGEAEADSRDYYGY